MVMIFSSVGQNKHKHDNSAHSCNSRFSNRDGDKEAKPTDCSFNSPANKRMFSERFAKVSFSDENIISEFFYHTIFFTFLGYMYV